MNATQGGATVHMNTALNVRQRYMYILGFINRLKGAANGFYPLVLGKKVNIEGYGYILVCKCV